MAIQGLYDICEAIPVEPSAAHSVLKVRDCFLNNIKEGGAAFYADLSKNGNFVFEWMRPVSSSRVACMCYANYAARRARQYFAHQIRAPNGISMKGVSNSASAASVLLPKPQ